MLKFKTIELLGIHRKSDIHFVPLFPGVFIDFNKDVTPEECDNILSHYGIGSEFYFHNDELSKVFLDFPIFTNIEIISDEKAENMLQIVKVNSSIKSLKVESYPKSMKGNPQVTSVLIARNSDVVFFFFDNVTSLDEDVTESDNLLFVKLFEDCHLALNKKNNSLYFLSVENYQNKYWFQEFAFSIAELGDDRAKSLRDILRQSFDLSHSISYFEKIIGKYLLSFESNQIPPAIEGAVKQILGNTLNQFVHNKKLNQS